LVEKASMFSYRRASFVYKSLYIVENKKKPLSDTRNDRWLRKILSPMVSGMLGI
jgi:hypothetical protein